MLQFSDQAVRAIETLLYSISTMLYLPVLLALALLSLYLLVAMGGFVGEWMVILGTVQASFWLAAIAATALILGAAYSLWMYKRVYLGAVGNDNVKNLVDLNAREFLVMAVLAVAVLFMGVYPKPFTDVMDASVAELLRHVAVSKLPQ